MAAPVIHGFDHLTSRAQGRAFPGLIAPHSSLGWIQSPQTVARYTLRTDDMLRIAGLLPEHPVHALVFDGMERPAPALLGLTANAPYPTGGVDDRPLIQTLNRLDLPRTPSVAALLPQENDALLLRATAACSLWLIFDVPDVMLVDGQSPGALSISCQPAQSATPRLPEPQGAVREEFTVPRGTAVAYELDRGESLQIIDVEGQQCSDFMAFSASALDLGREAMIDSTATRSMVRRAYPGPGLLDKFFDADMRPLMRVVQDTCGRHDTFGLACTARGYEERGFPGHINCSDNISGAVAPYGIARRSAWPAINFFWSTWVDPHSHQIHSEESWSRPGDFVTMEALEPLVCVSTACPDDIDPINGWNPTDVHVRIYRSDTTPLRRAIAHREKETAAMTLSQESAFHPATSKLTQDFVTARNLWVPNSYPSHGTLGEYWACREAVTVQDMSPLRKYDIIGPDAEALLQRALTKDVTKIAQWRGAYALMCDAQGQVIDDGTLFRLAQSLFRWCCGTEESARHLSALAAEGDLDVRINAMGDALPNVALQGPKSRDLLRDIVFTQPHVPRLDDLKWFGATTARLGDRDGIPFMLSRTGYTGELGYELFCTATDAPALWDAIMEAGAAHGIVPMGGAALEILRIEAGFAAAGAEFAPGVDVHEAGLGFAVSKGKDDFLGKTALDRNAQATRTVFKGLILPKSDVPAHGATVFAGERPVGIVTSATQSPTLGHAIAMARLAVEHSTDGTALQVGQLDGHIKRLDCTVSSVPFIDPTRSKARA